MKPIRQICAALFVASTAMLLDPALTRAESTTESATVPNTRTLAILSDVSARWFRGEWIAYKARFVSPDGRVIDNANGGISHSEGQGYGLLLALAAGDADSFDTIWHWTAANLQRRTDALFAWKWDPDQATATDSNNASDGDILIAWALVRGSNRFGRPDYMSEARRIVQALATKVVVKRGGSVLLMPGVTGFGQSDQVGGPVVNLSYWIFAAFRDLAPLAPRTDWRGLRESGLRLLEASRFGPRELPTDWIAVGGAAPRPAQNFAPRFGYDAIRIPLYLAQDPEIPAEALARFVTPDGPGAARNGPAVIDAPTGTAGQPMQGAGYRMIYALARCAANGDTVPPELMSTRDTLYYPETLRLLSISILQERLPRCL